MVTPVEVEELPVAGLRLWRRAIGLELQIELAERVEVPSKPFATRHAWMPPSSPGLEIVASPPMHGRCG